MEMGRFQEPIMKRRKAGKISKNNLCLAPRNGHTVGVKLKFPFTGCLSTVYRLTGNSFSCVFSIHTTDKLNMCSVISTS